MSLKFWLFSSFPVVALTNDHRVSGLEKHKFILLQFWRSEAWNGSHGSIIKWVSCQQSFIPSRASRGESLALSFPASGSCPCPSAHGLFLASNWITKTYACVATFPSLILTLQPPSYSPSYSHLLQVTLTSPVRTLVITLAYPE